MFILIYIRIYTILDQVTTLILYDTTYFTLVEFSRTKDLIIYNIIIKCVILIY